MSIKGIKSFLFFKIIYLFLPEEDFQLGKDFLLEGKISKWRITCLGEDFLPGEELGGDVLYAL